MYASLTGARTPGVFDELYVRDPPKTGPYVSVRSGAASVDGKRDVADSYSRGETVALIAASGYTTAEADALFRTEAEAVAALLLKRDVSDSLSTGEVDVLLAAKVDTGTYEATLLLKRDVIGSLSTAETGALLATKVDTDVYQAAISLKRDKEGKSLHYPDCGSVPNQDGHDCCACPETGCSDQSFDRRDHGRSRSQDGCVGESDGN
jgi:hypothetical protein